MSRTETKEKLIETGAKLILAKGYNNTGLQEIVKSAGVPKGSFYHFFESKEAFALEVLEAHVTAFRPIITSYLLAENVSPLKRLENFFNAGRNQLAEKSCEGGCLVGNLAQELADQDETFRDRLEQIMEGWQELFARCLSDAKQQGELSAGTDTSTLARFILDSWEGAILRSKVNKSIEPIDGFIQILFNMVLIRK